jgi:hypothetical protein
MAGLNPAVMDETIAQLSDAQLSQLLQNPQSQIPPFMVLAELKKRQQMRGAAKGASPAPTVRQEVEAKAYPPGIGGVGMMPGAQ